MSDTCPICGAPQEGGYWTYYICGSSHSTPVSIKPMCDYAASWRDRALRAEAQLAARWEDGFHKGRASIKDAIRVVLESGADADFVLKAMRGYVGRASTKTQPTPSKQQTPHQGKTNDN